MGLSPVGGWFKGHVEEQVKKLDAGKRTAKVRSEDWAKSFPGVKNKTFIYLPDYNNGSDRRMTFQVKKTRK